MPPALAPRPPSGPAIVSTPTKPTTTADTITTTVVAGLGSGGDGRSRPAVCRPIPGGSMRSSAMSGSGPRIVGTRATRTPRPTAVSGVRKTAATGPGVWCAGAAGTAARGGCAAPSASGTPRVLPTTTSVFISPGSYDSLFSVLLPFARSVGWAKPGADIGTPASCRQIGSPAGCRRSDVGVPNKSVGCQCH